MKNKVDSNVTGASFAEELTLKVLPDPAIWRNLEPNSYSDLGGDITNVARNPINASRQRQKGTVTDLDASGGFNSDYTRNNMQRLLQGFFFADAREKPSTHPLNGAQVVVSSTTVTDYVAAAGLGIFKAGQLILASGFGRSVNNGLALVSAAVAGSVTVAGKALVVEAAPPFAAKVEVVGFQFAAGDAKLVVTGTSVQLQSAAVNLTTLGLTPGEWVFIGGDATATQFTTNAPGYGRIKSIAAAVIEFSETTFPAVSDVGAAKTIRMFYGIVIRNEKDPTLIKRRSYQIERTLGEDDDGTQAEYLIGAIANEFTLNVPMADKLNCDLSFVAMDNEFRTGEEGLKAGTRIAIPGEDAYNTSSDIYRLRMNIVDPDEINNASLFGYITEATIGINNNVSPAKAVGVLGAFDANVGDFEFSGSVTAYFTTVAAVRAVRNNADVSLNMIAASDNAGFVFDAPLVGLGGGRLNVEKDNAIMLPLEAAGAENPLGYTALVTMFPYLPSVGMPTVD